MCAFVTGVQTCALPISAPPPSPGLRFDRPRAIVGRGYAPDAPRPLRIPGLGFDRPRTLSRSEERRVGKEFVSTCGYRWSQLNLNTNTMKSQRIPYISANRLRNIYVQQRQ